MSELAILGGSPVKKEIGAYAKWPVGGDLEKEALLRVYRSGQWGGGPENDAFEAAWASYCQCAYALTAANGTISLEQILRALEIGRGDEVILPSYTFVATASAIVMTGAAPVFADVDPSTYCLSAGDAESRITPKTRAIIAVHVGGRPCDMDALLALGEKYGLPVIEDAAQAHGSEWKGKRAGGMGLCGAFSFQASKNLSCGEGGAVTTNDRAMYEKIWNLGHNRRPGGMAYDNSVLGVNARMTGWQAGVLNANMRRIDSDIATRTANAGYLDTQFRRFPFLEPMDQEGVTRNSCHLYMFRYKKEGLANIPRSVFIKALQAENVSIPAEGYNQPIYDMALLYTEDFRKATGVTFTNPKNSLPNNEKAAHEEGSWFYQSTLLGGKKDMDCILEAMAKIEKEKDSLSRLA